MSFNNDTISIDDLKNMDVYLTPIRYNDEYNRFLKIIGRNNLHAIGIDDFIEKKKTGVYITTGLTKKFSVDLQLIEILNLKEEWGVIFKKGISKNKEELLKEVSLELLKLTKS